MKIIFEVESTGERWGVTSPNIRGLIVVGATIPEAMARAMTALQALAVHHAIATARGEKIGQMFVDLATVAQEVADARRLLWGVHDFTSGIRCQCGVTLIEVEDGMRPKDFCTFVTHRS